MRLKQQTKCINGELCHFKPSPVFWWPWWDCNDTTLGNCYFILARTTLKLSDYMVYIPPGKHWLNNYKSTGKNKYFCLLSLTEVCRYEPTGHRFLLLSEVALFEHKFSPSWTVFSLHDCLSSLFRICSFGEINKKQELLPTHLCSRVPAVLSGIYYNHMYFWLYTEVVSDSSKTFYWDIEHTCSLSAVHWGLPGWQQGSG